MDTSEMTGEMTGERSTASPSRYHELGPDECWDLLASTQVGRLVWNGFDGLSVATLNFAVDRRTILFRTLAYGSIARECDDSPVAFQVDQADEATRTGWSVLVRGKAHVEYGDTVPTHTVDAWPEGSRLLAVRVDPRRISGRRLTPGSPVSTHHHHRGDLR